MNKGDQCEVAIWMTGTEKPAEIEHWKTVVLEKIRKDTEANEEMEIGPFVVVEKRPGEERVPQVPDHVSGPDVRLLFATATVGDRKPRPKIAPKFIGFAEDLIPKDRALLRRLTREAAHKANPGNDLTAADVDRIIDEMGPDIAAKTIMGARKAMP